MKDKPLNNEIINNVFGVYIILVFIICVTAVGSSRKAEFYEQISHISSTTKK